MIVGAGLLHDHRRRPRLFGERAVGAGASGAVLSVRGRLAVTTADQNVLVLWFP
jgi:hypothetical protein